MSWTIHKSGQGYWTRLISGLAGGILVVTAAYWMWRVIDRYPNLSYGIYLQAGLAVAIIAVFGLMLYRYVACKPNTSDFLIATEGEMKKVNWPSKKEVIGSTWIVIVALAMLVAILFFSDLFFSLFFYWIGVLEINPFGAAG